LSGRGLCDELITRPEESYRLCCVVVCDLETSRMGAPYIYDISCLRVNTFCCIVLLTNRYNDRLFSLFKKLLIIPNRINLFTDLRANCSTTCFNQFCWDLISTWWFVFFSFSMAFSNSKAPCSSTSGSAVCMPVYLTPLTPCTLNIWEKWLLHLAKILWQSVTTSPFSSFTILVLGWQPFLKSMTPLYKALIFFILTVSFKFINFSFQIFLLFVPEMSTSFTS